MIITKHPHGRWTCGRVFDGETVHLVEGDWLEAAEAWRLFRIAAVAWRPEIGVKVMHHPVESVRFAALLPQGRDGRHFMTFEFIKLCFEALHPDWEHTPAPTNALTSVGV